MIYVFCTSFSVELSVVGNPLYSCINSDPITINLIMKCQVWYAWDKLANGEKHLSECNSEFE